MAKSRSLNKVELIGNLTRDPVLRRTSNGFTVCTFVIATNSRWTDAKGQDKERTEFHYAVSWNKLAEVCAQLLRVGMLVFVEGELRTRSIQEDDGRKVYKTEVKINDMLLLDAKGKQSLKQEIKTEDDPKTDSEPDKELF